MSQAFPSMLEQGGQQIHSQSGYQSQQLLGAEHFSFVSG